MALISAWKNGQVEAKLDDDTIRINVVSQGEYSSTCYLRIDLSEAVKLRDDLSAAILEAATAAAKAKAEEVA